MTRRYAMLSVTASLVLAACLSEPGDSLSDSAADLEDLPPTLDDGPVLTAPCGAGPVTSPRRLIVTTTDFSTGAVGLLDLETASFTPDLALATTDSLPVVHADGRVFVLHRYAFDSLDVLAGDNLQLQHQLSLGRPGVATSNPHGLALTADQAVITLFGTPELLVVDLGPGAPQIRDSIDLRALADADGNPEASLVIRCGDTVFVSIERLDAADMLTPTEAHAHVAAIDLPRRQIHDLDPDTPGVQAFPLLGPWAKQWQLDPHDPDGHTLLVLTSGLERVDLNTRTSTWAVDAALVTAALGSDDRFLTQAFALDTAGYVYFAAYRPDFTEVVLLRGDLDASTPLIEFASGLQAVERALVVTGETLWFGDRSPANPGLRAWDLTYDPPQPRFAGKAVATGLPPYALTASP